MQDNNYMGNDEIDLSKLLKYFKAHIRAMIVIVIISLLLGYGYTATRTTVYKSNATVAVMYTGNGIESTSAKYAYSASIVDTYVLFLSENIVLDKVAEKTGYSVSEIKRNLDVKSDNLILSLSFKDTNKKNAKIVLDTVIDTAIDIANSQEDGKPMYYLLTDGLKVFSSASEAKPIPILRRNMLIFFAIGILAAFGYVVLSWAFDRRYRDVEEIEEDLDLPVFTAVPYYTFEERKRQR